MREEEEKMQVNDNEQNQMSTSEWIVRYETSPRDGDGMEMREKSMMEDVDEGMNRMIQG